MKIIIISSIIAIAVINVFSQTKNGFVEKDGLVVVEAENYYSSEKEEMRKWYRFDRKNSPKIELDADENHFETASGKAYLEILPDTRRVEADKLINGENFSNKPGVLAILNYKIYFNTTGRFYVWVRAFSTGAEDNSVHVGLNGEWQASGQRMQWCEGKNAWRWESKQRTPQNHCGEAGKIYLDIDKKGWHTVSFSMREDGFEFDKWLMTTDADFKRPEDAGAKESKSRKYSGDKSN